MVGHKYASESMLDEQCSELEANLWRVVRLYEQRIHLLKHLADAAREDQEAELAKRYEADVKAIGRRAAAVRKLAAV